MSEVGTLMTEDTEKADLLNAFLVSVVLLEAVLRSPIPREVEPHRWSSTPMHPAQKRNDGWVHILSTFREACLSCGWDLAAPQMLSQDNNRHQGSRTCWTDGLHLLTGEPVTFPKAAKFTWRAAENRRRPLYCSWCRAHRSVSS